MRLFFAITFDERMKDNLCAVIEKIRPCCEKGRFTKPENLHLTLIFLGETLPVRSELAKQALFSISTASFPLHIGGFGCFRRDGGDIFWAGVERTEPLLCCHQKLFSELREKGFSLEKRCYRPHLTLVRQAVLKKEYDPAELTVPTMRMMVKKISLMKSERTDNGMVYTEIFSKMLEQEAER